MRSGHCTRLLNGQIQVAFFLILSQERPKPISNCQAPSAITIRSRQRQDSLQELVIVDLNPTIAVAVKSGERLGYLLHNDARAHKAVERDARLNPWVGTVGLWCRRFHVLNE